MAERCIMCGRAVSEPRAERWFRDEGGRHREVLCEVCVDRLRRRGYEFWADGWDTGIDADYSALYLRLATLPGEGRDGEAIS